MSSSSFDKFNAVSATVKRQSDALLAVVEPFDVPKKTFEVAVGIPIAVLHVSPTFTVGLGKYPGYYLVTVLRDGAASTKTRVKTAEEVQKHIAALISRHERAHI